LGLAISYSLAPSKRLDRGKRPIRGGTVRRPHLRGRECPDPDPTRHFAHRSMDSVISAIRTRTTTKIAIGRLSTD
jgi:hypothetical protein